MSNKERVMNLPTLHDLTEQQLGDLAEMLLNAPLDLGDPSPKPLTELLLPLRVYVATEQRRRRIDEDAASLVLDHGGHEAWTDDEAGGGSHLQAFAAYCLCGWSTEELPSVGAADQRGETHVRDTGGRWRCRV